MWSAPAFQLGILDPPAGGSCFSVRDQESQPQELVRSGQHLHFSWGSYIRLPGAAASQSGTKNSSRRS